MIAQKNQRLNRNKTSIDTIYRGLLLAVVLFYLITACRYSSSPSTAPKTTDSLALDPMRYFLFGNGQSSTSPDSLSAQELALFQEGDILLRKGFGAISNFIADFLAEKYPVTHCGWVVHGADGSVQILHTISNDSISGMTLEPLDSYQQQSQANSLVLIRLQDPSQIQEILHLARQRLAQQVPFDMEFNDKNSDALYCIELMRDVFLDVYQKDLLPNRTNRHGIDVLSMANFFDSTNFQIIFNHFEQPNIN